MAQNAFAQSSNRWLLVVETSRSMRRRAAAAEQFAAGMVGFGMGGQMRRGDTVGLWTFNDNLHAGNFPLQHWSPESRQIVAQHIFDFLRSQKFAGEGRLQNIFPPLQQVIRDSPLVTIILITDGAEEIRGTPFDTAINTTWKSWQEQQQKAGQPLLTLLRARGGKITDYSVAAPPWPLELPPLPPEPKHVEAAQTKPVERPRPAPPVFAPPLILRGEKSGPAPAAPPPPPAKPAVKTNSPADVPAVAPQKSEPRAAPAPTAATLATNPPVAVPSPDSPKEIRSSPPPETEIESTASPPAVEASARIEQKNSASAAPRQPQAPTAEPKADESAVNVPARSETAALPAKAPVQTAAAAPSETFVMRRVWIAIGGLVAAAAVLVFLLVRRSRNSGHASLITRSLNSGKK